MRKIVCLLLCSIFFSCIDKYGKNKNPRNDFPQQSSCNLVEAEEIQFCLDSVTLNIFTASQYIPEARIYSFLTSDKTIVLYNYDTKKLIYKFFLDVSYPTSYQFVGPDSLFVWDYAENAISLYYKDGKKLYTKYVSHLIEYYPSPATRTSPMIYTDGQLSIIGNIAGEYDNETDENRKVLMQVNLETSEVRYHMPYPDIYSYNWTGGLFRWIYTDYNNMTGQYIFSFPADHFIYIYDNNTGRVEKKYGGSNRLSETRYMKAPKSKYIDPDSRTKHFVESNSYSRIIYDPYQKVYYRFAEMGIKYQGIPGWKKPVSIVIMDENFNIIGETNLGPLTSTYRYGSFVNEYGLHIPKDVGNEDILSFTIYKLMYK